MVVIFRWSVPLRVMLLLAQASAVWCLEGTVQGAAPDVKTLINQPEKTFTDAAGPFYPVSEGSSRVSPPDHENPGVSEINYREASGGNYRVRADGPDCSIGENRVLTYPPATDLVLALGCGPISLGADSSFTLHQDPSDGATGFKLIIARLFETDSGDSVRVNLRSFQAEFTYPDAAADPALPAETRCVQLLGLPRAVDLPFDEFTIDNAAGSATFAGFDGAGVPWPVDLGHFPTRLNGGANQSCRVDLGLSLTGGVGGIPIGIPIMVPAVLTQILHRGDVQADGDVTIDDPVFIAKYLVGSGDECFKVEVIRCLRWVNAASVRQDGAFDRVNIADALFIAQYLVGSRNEFYNLVR